EVEVIPEGHEGVEEGGVGEAAVVPKGAVGEELHVAGRADLGGGEVLAVELDGEWEGDLFDAGLAVGAGDYGGAGDDGSAGGEGVGVVLGAEAGGGGGGGGGGRGDDG